MCLIAFAIGASARWPLVIAANRDEFLNRPTQPLGRWRTAHGQEIISGRDLRAGGTWLGMTSGGRVAFLTNVREAKPQAAPRSRGELVTRWLEEGGDAEAFALALQKDGAAYGGFNLVLGDFQRNAWTWITNKSAAASTLQVQPLEPGVYGLSNAALNTPWPKTTALKRVLAAALTEANAPESDAPDAMQDLLWTGLANRERARSEQLPATGVPLAFEEALSSAFVEFPEHAYGTRCSTVLLASAQDSREGARRWDVRVEERTHLHAEQPAKEIAGASHGHSSATPQTSSFLVPWQQLPAL
ncbi:NRDE family protein [Polaromonas sp. UBA4122]|uniref:NRDE family protein n=1 Tax=Polaromonas sp. UBA4122 TaxID=1947074 RepID=UPI0025DD8509|nr:NRDE family protein [Polaromonas sp. UBA4122]